jgi:hypothetical protein
MKPLSETLTELGIEFTFPIEIYDAKGNRTYFEASDGFWQRCEYDDNGKETYYEDSDDFWARYERDANGKVTYFENSDDYWYKYERDANGNETYYENSKGVKRGTPKSAKTCEGKVVEVDGIKYKLKAL